MQKLLLLFLMLLTGLTAEGQVISNTGTERSINQLHYTRLYYENDFFTATDEFYTQGIYYEIVHPWFKKLPTSKILPRLRNSTTQYGLAGQHNAYTPKKIDDPNIRYGERPYAAVVLVQLFAISTNKEKGRRLNSTFNTGFIGDIAGGHWMQKTIHKSINGIAPQGWHNQIHNDFVLNYRAEFEQKLFNAGKIALVTAKGSINAGTLNTSAGIGGNVMLGYIDGPFSRSQHYFNIYLYYTPSVSAIGYDATLQGGLLNRSSPYTINDIERITTRQRGGIVIKAGRSYIEYFYTYSSKTYETGGPHWWGGLQAGLSF